MSIPEAIRIAVVEDNRAYRESLGLLFRHAEGFVLERSFSSAPDALAALDGDIARGRLRWDLVLMDVDLPGISGIEATREIKARCPELRVVVLTVFEEPTTILEAICAGADGYLLKKSATAELLSQLRAIVDGGAPLTPAVARTVLEIVRRTGGRETDTGSSSRISPAGHRGSLDLTDREQQVLRGLVHGFAYKQVADQLGVSLDTVRTHIRSIYRKLQVHSVAEAVSRAIHDRLV